MTLKAKTKLLLSSVALVLCVLFHPHGALADGVCVVNQSPYNPASALYFYPLCTSTGALQVAIVSGGGTGGGASGTPGSTGSTAQYVQGVPGGYPIPVTGTFTSTTTFPYSATQGQTASAASFLGAVGAYYTTAPTLTNGQINPLSVDQNGYLNVDVKVGGGGGGGIASFPFTMNTASPQPGQTAAAIGVVGLVQGTTTVQPIQIDPTTGALLTKSAGSANGTYAAPGVTVSPAATSVQYEQGIGPNGTTLIGPGTYTIGSIGNAAFGITGAGTAGGGPQTATSIPAIAAGCVYNSTPLTPTTGQYVPFTCNSSGALQIAGTFTATTQFPYTMVTYAQTAQAASALGIVGAYYAAPTLTTGQVSPARMDASADIYTQVNNPSSNPVPVYAPSALPISGSITAVSSYPYPSTTSSPGLAASSVGISCAYNGATQPTLTSGQISPILCNTVGDQVMAIDTTSGSGVFSSQATSGYVRMVDASNTNTANVFAPSADGLAATQKGIGSNSFGYYYNGSAFNRARDAVIGNNVIGAGVGAVSPYVQYNSTLPTLTTAQYGAAQASVNGIQYAGTAAVTGVGATRYGVTTVTAAAAQPICSTACTAYSISAINTSGVLCYIQEFNTASASVTVGTTAPVRILAIPATAGSEAADSIPPTVGEAFSTAWSYAATTTPTGSTTCGSSVYVQADYK